MTVLRAAAETHTGYVRAINQDQAVVSGDLVAIADGMGGHLGGEVAARTAIEELVAAFRRDRTPDGLVSAVQRANRAIWRRSRVDRKLHGMGTTLTAAALASDPDGSASAAAGGDAHLTLVNIGDSRAYRLDPDGPSLVQLTEDHTVVEEMVRHGDLSAAEASVHPHRHVLTRALGIDPDVALDVWDLELERGSRLLLCSDGLTNEVTEDDIASVLAAEEDPYRAAQELVGRALGHGGMDNVTVIVVDVAEGGNAADVPLQMVPARAADLTNAVDDTTDITQALPVTPAATPPAGSDRAAEDEGLAAAASGMAADDEGFEGGSGDSAGSSGDRWSGDDPGDGSPATVAMSTAELAAAGGAGAVAGAVAEGGGTIASGLVSSRPQGARSMTVRDPGEQVTVGGADPGAAGAGAAAADGAEATRGRGNGSAAVTQHHRAVVLVPEGRRLGVFRDRVVTPRVAVYVLLVLAVFGGVLGTVIWFNQSSFYVGLDGSRVAIYQGRPGGMLWFRPQLVEVSRLKTHDLFPATRSQLRSGVTESSYPAARRLVSFLAREHRLLALGTTTSTLPTTTAPPSTAYSPSTTAPPPSSSPSSTSPSNATTTTVAPTTSTSPPTSTSPSTLPPPTKPG